MTTKVKFYLPQILILAWALPSASQSRAVEIRASAEYRVSGAEDPETGRKLALALARRNVLQESVIQLRKIDEVKAVSLRANELDALLPGILEIEEVASQSKKVANETVYEVSVKVSLNPSEIARRVDRLSKDPIALAGLMEVRRQAEVLYRQVAQPAGAGVLSEQARIALVNKLNVNRMLTSVYASLAKTEESPASSRVASLKGSQRAMQLAEIAMVAEPDSQETHFAMGDALIQSNQTTAAVTEYRQALLLGPNSSRVHIKLAEALRLEENLPEAIAELRDAIRIDPSSAMAHGDLGFILAAQQNTTEAISEYHEAIQIDPDLIEPHNNLAIALARQGRIPEAVAEFREILRIDSSSVLGYYNLAIALADMDKDDESAEALRQAVHYNPKHFNARYNLGEMFRLEGKLDEAVKQFREYLRLAPDTPQNQRNIRRATDFVKTHENP
jgi:tetratricopeptide (TPR) repeat protein